MNWLDQAIGYLSPKTQFEREAYRRALEEQRSYDAADYGRLNRNWRALIESAEMTDRQGRDTAQFEREAYRRALEEQRSYDAADYGRLNRNWRALIESAEMTDRQGRDTVRARARDMERNSDVMNSVIGAYRRNVFGKGYRLRANTGKEEWNQQMEHYWRIWCKKQNCDVTGTQSFNAMMRMAVRRKKVDGGILFLKRYVGGGLLPFKLQAIEVDELDLTAVKPKVKGNKVVGGIEYNSYNRPMGYWIRQYSIDGMDAVEPIYIEAKDVIFFFTKTRPSQIREMSDMTPTMTRIRDMNEFMRAVGVKERILACLSAFIKRSLPQAGYGRSGTIEEGAAGSEERYQGKTLTPGMIQYLNPGDEVQVVNPSGQATDATSYMKQELRLVGAGQGLSYETVSRDMSESNYSSARQGMIEDDLTYEEDKEQLLEVMDEIYESFVISLVLSGKVDLPDFWGEKKEAYLSHSWIQAPKRWIDPVKEANANKTALNTGQKTWADMAAENGRDWKEQVDELAEIMKYGQEKGIDMGGVIFGKSVKTDGNAGKS